MFKMASQKILQETTDADAAKWVLKAMQLGGFTSFLDSQMAQQVRAPGTRSLMQLKPGSQAMQCAGLEPCLPVGWLGTDCNVTVTFPPG